MIIRLRDHKIAYKLIFSFAFLLFFLFAFTFKGYAATTSNGDLPYVVPSGLNINTYATSQIIDYAKYNYENYMSTFEPNVTVNSYLVFTTDGFYNDSIYSFIFVTNPTIEDSYSDSLNFYDNTIRVHSNGSDIHTLVMGANGDFWGMSNNGTIADLCGNSSTITTAVGTFTPRYPFLLVGVDELLSSNDVIIFTNNVPYSPNVPTQGHATQPTNNPNNFINGSNGQPITRPTQPTINNYNWTTYNAPPIDTTSLESLVESLIDNVVYGFEYLKDNLSGEFSNLINNIESLINYVVLSLENGFNKVIQAIQDVMTDLYNNFVSLFEPITEQLSYITQPFDSSNFESQLNNTSAMNILNVCSTSFDTFKSTFTNVSEPESYILQLDFNMPSTSILSSYIVDGEINFNWLIPLKSVYRPLLWILFIAFAFISILTNIGNYLKGFSGGSDG